MNCARWWRWTRDRLGDAWLLLQPPSPPRPLFELTRLHLVLGTRCNCRCAMCYQAEFAQMPDPAPLAAALRPVFPHLREIILQGGEPTVLPATRPFAELVLRDHPAVRFAMFTNGQRFDKEWAAFFVTHGSYVNFSVNAATEATYLRLTSGDADWSRLLVNIRRFDRQRAAQGARVRLQTSFLAGDGNLEELSAFLDLSLALSADTVQVFFDPRQLPRDRSAAARELERARAWRVAHPRPTVEGLEMFSHYVLGTPPPAPPACRWPLDSLHVDADGTVRFCCLMHKPLGSLPRSGVEALWNNWRARRLRRMVGAGRLRFCGHYCRAGSVRA